MKICYNALAIRNTIYYGHNLNIRIIPCKILKNKIKLLHIQSINETALCRPENNEAYYKTTHKDIECCCTSGHISNFIQFLSIEKLLGPSGRRHSYVGSVTFETTSLQTLLTSLTNKCLNMLPVLQIYQGVSSLLALPGTFYTFAILQSMH